MVEQKNKDTKQLIVELNDIYRQFAFKLDELRLQRDKIVKDIDKRLQDSKVSEILDKIKNIE